MSVTNPIYRVEFWSGSFRRYVFGSGEGNLNKSYINSVTIKPGLTHSISSFEVEVPDSTGSLAPPGIYKDVLPFEDVYIWMGYDSTGSLPLLKGKIETIRSSFSVTQGGWTRTFIGRDYGECLFRILAYRGWTGSVCSNITKDLRDLCTGPYTGNLSISNLGIHSGGSEQTYSAIALDRPVFDILKEVSDFDMRDHYVTIGKELYSFERGSYPTELHTFTTGSEILECTVDRDITGIYNDIFIFGPRDPSYTGSDWPALTHDYCETGSPGGSGSWTAHIVDAGIPSTLDTDLKINWFSTPGLIPTGSGFFYCQTPTLSAGFEGIITMTKALPTQLMLRDGDFVHFYSLIGTNGGAGSTPSINRIRLKTSETDYFESIIESWNNVTQHLWNDGGHRPWQDYERNIYCGPSYEGLSVTGSIATNSGSYKWVRIGNPDWYDINSIEFYGIINAVGGTFDGYILVDGLYFGTKFQGHTGSIVSQTKYGYRRFPEENEKYTSNQYCQNVAKSYLLEKEEYTNQVHITVTGSPYLQAGHEYIINFGTDNISGSYYLIDLEHKISKNGFISKCIFSDRQESRIIVPTISYPIREAQRQATWSEYLSVAMRRMGLIP